MELVNRMMDGSIPYDVKGTLRGSPYTGPPIGRDERIERLGSVPIFEELSKRQLRAVAKITEVVEVPGGKVLTRAGEPGDEFFLILDGRAIVEVSARKRSRLGPGDFFGEMSLLDGGPRSATVVADTDLRLLVMHRRNFRTLLTQVPELTQRILVTLSRRVRQAEASLQS